MAATLVHDFNNILGAVRGYAELAQDEVEKNSELEFYLVQIIESVDRASELVRQMSVEEPQ